MKPVIIIAKASRDSRSQLSHPLRNAACMRASVIRWKLYGNKILCWLPDIITHL
ncbi:MAG: hypothetical protein IIB02_08985 [Thaumarchaeota archaeon]|nr:hypothetical protein [Nitrososphaerota archaeon]